MEDFFRKYRNFLLSVLYVAGALLVAGYAVMYSARSANIGRVAAAVKVYAAENKEFQDILNKKKKALDQDGAGQTAINYLPAFLERINNIANQTEVIIQKLNPDKTSKYRFTLEIVDDYFKFIRFASMLESLNVSIHDIQVHPYDISKTPPLHAISFSLTPRADAVPLASARLDELKGKVEALNKRNPFQRFAYSKNQQKILHEIDLTWVNKLSGIGKVGDNRYATIDGKDYNVDDKVDGMKITVIEADRVYLIKETPNGIEKYQMKFRVVKDKKK